MRHVSLATTMIQTIILISDRKTRKGFLVLDESSVLETKGKNFLCSLSCVDFLLYQTGDKSFISSRFDMELVSS